MKSPEMQIRRLLLDGIKIIQPYQRCLRDSNKTKDGKVEDQHIRLELALMETWITMARVVALKLKKANAVNKDA